MAAINMTTPPQAIVTQASDVSTPGGGIPPAPTAASDVSAHVSANSTVTQGDDQATDESITSYVNNLLPGNGAPTSPINTPGSMTPPVTTAPLLSVHEVQSISSPISTAPLPIVTSAAPSVHLAQSVAPHYVYQAPITSGVPTVPMYSGHPIPSPLWQGQSSTGNYVFASVGQAVPIAGQAVPTPVPAPYRPPGGSYGQLEANPLGGSRVPTIPYSAAFQFAPGVPTTSTGVGFTNLIPVGVSPQVGVTHSIGATPPAPVGVSPQGIAAQPAYSYAPASGTPYWGGGRTTSSCGPSSRRSQSTKCPH